MALSTALQNIITKFQPENVPFVLGGKLDCGVYEGLAKSQLLLRMMGYRDYASFIQTLVSDVLTESKRTNPPKDLSDALFVAAIKKVINTNNQSIVNVANNPSSAEYVQKMQVENELLQMFMPRQLTEAELQQIFVQQKVTSIPEGMKLLKAEYEGRYDGKMAASVLNRVLGI